MDALGRSSTGAPDESRGALVSLADPDADHYVVDLLVRHASEPVVATWIHDAARAQTARSRPPDGRPRQPLSLLAGHPNPARRG